MGALGAGAVSFAQIAKAAEPVFAAATNALLLKDIDHPMGYAALLPIIGGVGLASLKEMSFTWTALIAASLANQSAAFKNVVSKGVMKKPWAKGLGPQNTYSVVNILALIATLPFVAFFDAKDFVPVWETIKAAGKANEAIKYSVLSGLAFYLYNEASFLCLSRLSPVTPSSVWSSSSHPASSSATRCRLKAPSALVSLSPALSSILFPRRSTQNKCMAHCQISSTSEKLSDEVASIKRTSKWGNEVSEFGIEDVK